MEHKLAINAESHRTDRTVFFQAVAKRLLCSSDFPRLDMLGWPAR